MEKSHKGICWKLSDFTVVQPLTVTSKWLKNELTPPADTWVTQIPKGIIRVEEPS
jgi:hypothetical protein